MLLVFILTEKNDGKNNSQTQDGALKIISYFG